MVFGALVHQEHPGVTLTTEAADDHPSVVQLRIQLAMVSRSLTVPNPSFEHLETY